MARFSRVQISIVRGTRVNVIQEVWQVNGFSKKVENHANAVALHFAYYNFVRIHKTLRMTPAMAAGVTDRLWDMSDLVAVLEAAELAEAQSKVRGPYKKRVTA